MYYYSSGYIDDAKVKVLQGVVKVDPLVDKSNEISVRVGGMEARHVIGGRYDIEQSCTDITFHTFNIQETSSVQVNESLS